MKYNEIILKVYELDSHAERQPLFDWVVSETDELFTNGEFDVVNQVFANIDPRKLSLEAITALLMSTFAARPKLPSRKAFIANEITRNIMREGREEGLKFLDSQA